MKQLQDNLVQTKLLWNGQMLIDVEVKVQNKEDIQG